MASTRSPSTFTHKHTHLKICHKYTWVYKKKITNTIPTIVLPRRRTMRDYTAQSPDYTREMNGSMDNQRRDKTLGAHTSHQFCFTGVCVCGVMCVFEYCWMSRVALAVCGGGDGSEHWG